MAVSTDRAVAGVLLVCFSVKSGINRLATPIYKGLTPSYVQKYDSSYQISTLDPFCGSTYPYLLEWGWQYVTSLSTQRFKIQVPLRCDDRLMPSKIKTSAEIGTSGFVYRLECLDRFFGKLFEHHRTHKHLLKGYDPQYIRDLPDIIRHVEAM